MFLNHLNVEPVKVSGYLLLPPVFHIVLIFSDQYGQIMTHIVGHVYLIVVQPLILLKHDHKYVIVCNVEPLSAAATFLHLHSNNQTILLWNCPDALRTFLQLIFFATYPLLIICG